MEEGRYYHAAAYLRLSREDEAAGKGCFSAGQGWAESGSIRSQREIICAYVEKQDDIEIHDFYVDDGYSGVNFDRPGFLRMMEDVRAGKVDCVIVKDLSRLGRDYIGAGRLLQKTFPAFSVRFIALNDNFDSLTADYHETSLVLPVKNFVNDAYCRDISCKVRSQQKVKRESGAFIGAFCAYGYKKSDADRNRLEPDEAAASVVRKIFRWKMEGYSATAIARRLDGFGVPSPMEYKRLRGENFKTGFAAGIQTGWSAVAVERILSNEIYIGNLAQGKEERINYKVKRSRKKPREEWIRAEGTHKAVVSKEDFQTVQELLQAGARASKGSGKAHKYTGLLFCGDCGKPMARRAVRVHGKEEAHFICSSRNRGEGCGRHDVAERTLDEILLLALNLQIALNAEEETLAARVREIGEKADGTAAIAEEMRALKKELEKYPKLQAALYEDWKNGIVAEADFKTFREIYRMQEEKLRQAAESQKMRQKEARDASCAAKGELGRMEREMRLAGLGRMELLTLVRRVFVYEGKRIRLELRVREGE